MAFPIHATKCSAIYKRHELLVHEVHNTHACDGPNDRGGGGGGDVARHVVHVSSSCSQPGLPWEASLPPSLLAPLSLCVNPICQAGRHLTLLALLWHTNKNLSQLHTSPFLAPPPPSSSLPAGQ